MKAKKLICTLYAYQLNAVSTQLISNYFIFEVAIKPLIYNLKLII